VHQLGFITQMYQDAG